MNNLERSLLALAKEDRVGQAPPHVRTAVMQAWDSMHPFVRPRRRRGAATALLVLGSVAAAVVVMIVSGAPSLPLARRDPVVTPLAEPPRAVAHAAPAVPITHAETAMPRPRPRRLPARREITRPSYDVGVVLVADLILDPSAISIVRVRVPSTALATLGLPLVEPNDGGSVDLEMIVGEDGVARTIRRAVPVAVRQE